MAELLDFAAHTDQQPIRLFQSLAPSAPDAPLSELEAMVINASSPALLAWLAEPPPWLSDPIAFLRCWRHQDCIGCVEEENARCGWCAISSACLPLPPSVPPSSSSSGSESAPEHRPLLSPPPIPLPRILLPLRYANICPQPSERYELRSAPLKCGISTATLLGATAGAGILLGLQWAICVLGVLLAAILAAWQGRTAGWWRVWRYRLGLVNRRREGGNMENGGGDDSGQQSIAASGDTETRWTVRPRGWTPRVWKAYRGEGGE